MMFSQLGRTRCALVVLALAAYVPGFWWGAPHATAADRTNAWGVDDEPPLGPLAQAHDIVYPKKEMNPNLGYPMLHPFMVLGAFAPYMGYQLATGGIQRPTVAYPHGFRDPVTALRQLTLIAHFLSVLLGVGIVLAAFETGRILWDLRSGVGSAIAVLLMYPMFYYARNSNVDVPVLFFTAVALACFANIVTNGLTRSRALWFATAVGCAVATKEPSFASFLFAPVAMLLLPNPGETRAPWRHAAFWRIALPSAAVALVAYALASGMVVDFRRWSAHITFAQTRIAEAKANGVPWVTLFPWTISGNLEFVSLLGRLTTHALSIPGAILGVLGVADAARRTPRQAVLALSAIGYLLVLFVSVRFAQLRYMMPVALVLAIYAGRLVTVALSHREPGRAMRAITLSLGGATALTLTLWAIDLTAGMLRDSRYAAGAWLLSNARPGDALEYFGSEHKHPPMPKWLSSRQVVPFLGSTIRPDTTASGVAAVAQALNERRPRFIALVPDYTSAPRAPHAASCPPQIFRQLEDGSLGYHLAAQFQSAPAVKWPERPPLDYPVVNPPIRIYERTQ